MALFISRGCLSARKAMIVSVLLTALRLLMFAVPVEAGDEYDIRQPIEAGEVVPLQRLVTQIRQDFGGRILKVELERESHAGDLKWVYEAKILTPDGRVLKLEYDASNLKLLELKGRHEHHQEEDDD